MGYQIPFLLLQKQIVYQIIEVGQEEEMLEECAAPKSIKNVILFNLDSTSRLSKALCRSP
jgi:hypothetical protein